MNTEDGLFAPLGRFTGHRFRGPGLPKYNRRVCTSRMYVFPTVHLGVEIRYSGDVGGPVFEVTSWHYDVDSHHFWYDDACFTHRGCTQSIVVAFLQLVCDLDIAMFSSSSKRLGPHFSEWHQHVGVVVGRCHPLAVAVA